MRRLAVIPISAALLLLGAGCTPATSNAPPAAIPEGAPVISMTSDGFTPPSLEVPTGTTVYFRNDGVRNHWPASAVHPTHQEYPGFDAFRSIPPGDHYRFTFDRPGTWRFHDHLNPAKTGAVTVTE